MSFTTAWTDKDCRKNQPRFVTEEKWVACKVSRAKIGFVVAIVISIIIMILILIFAPGLYKLFAAGVGVLFIGGGAFSLYTAKANAEAEYETSVQPIYDFMKRKNITDFEVGRAEYNELEEQRYMARKEERMTADTNRTNAAMVGTTVAGLAGIAGALFGNSSKKTGGDSDESPGGKIETDMST